MDAEGPDDMRDALVGEWLSLVGVELYHTSIVQLECVALRGSTRDDARPLCDDPEHARERVAAALGRARVSLIASVLAALVAARDAWPRVHVDLASERRGHAAWVAASRGDVDALRGALDGRPCTWHEEACVLARTPLHVAAQHGRTAAIALMCAVGTDVNAPAGNGYTPLHYACSRGHAESVRVLLRAGARPWVRDAHGWMPLHSAVNHGHAAVVRVLASVPCNLDAAIQGDMRTAVHIASEYGHAEALDALLRAGADGEACDLFGASCAHFAARSGHTHVLRVLWAHGVSIANTTNVGRHTLVGACQLAHREAAMFLLEHTARADTRHEGMSLLEVVIEGRSLGYHHESRAGWSDALALHDMRGALCTSAWRGHAHARTVARLGVETFARGWHFAWDEGLESGSESE